MLICRTNLVAIICLTVTGTLIFNFKKLNIEATDPEIQFIDGKAFYRHQPFTGEMIERNLNHDLLARVHYKYGEKEGISYTYHHDGVVVAKSFFHQGKKE